MNINNIVISYKSQGYQDNYAIAKACHDIFLLELSKSKFINNVTIKGGVLMHDISKDIRRATRDLDIDFIQLSINEDSIRNFISELNNNDDDIHFVVTSIKPLHHQNYKGKEVILLIRDTLDSYSMKLDIGVHTKLNLHQDEYYFNIGCDDFAITLFANPKEQIIAEKLKSLLKYGQLSTRYKDIFDIYYLLSKTKLDNELLKRCINELIINDTNLNIIDLESLHHNLCSILNDPLYIEKLNSIKNNWTGSSINVVVTCILDYIKEISK